MSMPSIDSAVHCGMIDIFQIGISGFIPRTEGRPMPLIRVNYSHDYAPNTETGFGRELLMFCRKLPSNLEKNRDRLGLDATMSADDVEITFREYQQFDIGTADVQFRMEFTEQLDPQALHALRDALTDRVCSELLGTITDPHMVVLDIYAGAWCGALILGGRYTKNW